MSPLYAKLWAEEGTVGRGRSPWVLTANGAVHFLFASFHSGQDIGERQRERERRQEREAGLAGCDLQDPVSKQKGSSDPSQCQW